MQPHWLAKIMEGQKSIELRKRPTIPGWLALVPSRYPAIVAIGHLDRSEKLTLEELASLRSAHGVAQQELADYARPHGHLHAWHLAEIEVLKDPVPIERPHGSVGWVVLSPAQVAAAKAAPKARTEKERDLAVRHMLQMTSGTSRSSKGVPQGSPRRSPRRSRSRSPRRFRHRLGGSGNGEIVDLD